MFHRRVSSEVWMILGTLNMMERTGPGTNYDIPANLVLLAGKSYAVVPPVHF